MNIGQDKPGSPSDIVKNYILTEISEKRWKPNTLIPSEAELCRLFGASRFSVRKALSELVFQKRIYTIPGKGSLVAEPPKGLGVNIKAKVGLVVPKSINDHFIGTIIMAVEQRLAEKGISVVLACTNNDVAVEQERITQQAKDGLNGIILWASDCMPGVRDYSCYHALRIPLVFVDRYLPEIPGDRVLGCDREGAVVAATHLLQHGRKRIGYFNSDIVPTIPSIDRLNGMLLALHQHGIAPDPRYIVDHVPNLKGMPKEQHHDIAKDRVRQYLVDNPELEAVITCNDLMAAHFYAICHELGMRIPDDLAIISFSNSELCPLLRPELTSIDQNPSLIGTTAAELIIDSINSYDSAIKQEQNVRVPYRLVTRRSCGC